MVIVLFYRKNVKVFTTKHTVPYATTTHLRNANTNHPQLTPLQIKTLQFGRFQVKNKDINLIF